MADRFFDTQNPDVIEAIMVRGDMLAVKATNIHPAALPYVPEVYYRGAFGWTVPYAQPELHPQYNVGNIITNPTNYHRAMIQVFDWFAESIYSLNVNITVLGVPIIVQVPSIAALVRPWPIPGGP